MLIIYDDKYCYVSSCTEKFNIVKNRNSYFGTTVIAAIIGVLSFAFQSFLREFYDVCKKKWYIKQCLFDFLLTFEECVENNIYNMEYPDIFLKNYVGDLSGIIMIDKFQVKIKEIMRLRDLWEIKKIRKEDCKRQLREIKSSVGKLRCF